MKKKYYVYVHYCTGFSAPVYIGKGTAFRAWSKSKRSKKWNEATGGNPDEVVIVLSDMSEPCALTLERIMIGFWGTTQLANIALSGVGQSGVKQSAESNEKRRQALLGEKNHNFGKPLPAHVLEAARKAQTGRKQSESEKAKKSFKVSGKKHPQLDRTKRKFKHNDGSTFEGLRFDFIKK